MITYSSGEYVTSTENIWNSTGALNGKETFGNLKIWDKPIVVRSVPDTADNPMELQERIAYWVWEEITQWKESIQSIETRWGQPAVKVFLMGKVQEYLEADVCPKSSEAALGRDWSVEEVSQLSNWLYQSVISLDTLQKNLQPDKKLLFTCRGRVDKIAGDTVYATTFKNRYCDDPQGLKLTLEDFADPDELKEGHWFEYTQYREKTESAVTLKSVIKTLTPDAFTNDELIEEYERLRDVLPDEF